MQVTIQSVTIGKDQYRKVIHKRSKKIEKQLSNLNCVVNVGQIISKLCFKQSLFNDLVLADSSTRNNLRALGFPSGKCCTYFSFLRTCKIIAYRFFCVHVAHFLLLCHICTCTFVTGVCKLKRFIDFANISIRTSLLFFFIRYEKTINIMRPSKKTPKQSISYEFVAVTLAKITFQSDIFIFPVLNFFFCETNFETAILSEQPSDNLPGADPY